MASVIKNFSFSRDAASTPTGVQYKTTVVLASKLLNCLIFYASVSIQAMKNYLSLKVCFLDTGIYWKTQK